MIIDVCVELETASRSINQNPLVFHVVYDQKDNEEDDEIFMIW